MAAFFNTIILLGALQGFIVSSLLFFSKKKRLANRILAMLILIIALASFNLYGSYVNWFGAGLLQLLAQIIPLVLPMAIGPLMYFYVQSLLDPEFKIAKKQRRHFFLVMIDLVPSITTLVYLVGIITKTVTKIPAPWSNFIDNYNVYADIPRWTSVSCYVWLSYKYLLAYKLKHNGTLNILSVSFNWLNQFIKIFFGFQLLWFVYLVPYVIPRYTYWMLNTFNWYPIYLPMAVMIYWLGIKGYTVSVHANVSDKKNSTTSLPEELIEMAISALTRAMEEGKAYLNPNCNLSLMSEKTGLAQRIISTVLNQHLQKSFNDFVNEYRVNECKEKMGAPEMNNLTIAGVAFECGFSSQATFQRVFKNNTGLTPREYISKKAQQG